jgi:hypothetical protein
LSGHSAHFKFIAGPKNIPSKAEFNVNIEYKIVIVYFTKPDIITIYNLFIYGGILLELRSNLRHITKDMASFEIIKDQAN